MIGSRFLAPVAVAVLLTFAITPQATALANGECSVNGVVQSGATISGTPGNDRIECLRGVSSYTTISAGDGDDTIVVPRGNGFVNWGVIDGGDGNDSIDVGRNYVAGGEILGGRGADTIRVDAQEALVQGGEDDDVIIIGHTVWTTSASVQGNGGDDTIRIDTNALNSLVDGGAGADTIEVTTNESEDDGSRAGKVYGGSGDDHIRVTNNKGDIDGQGGDDTITVPLGGYNTGIVYAAGGDDTVDVAQNRSQPGPTRRNVVGGGPGSDVLTVTENSGAIVEGGADDDVIVVDRLVRQQPRPVVNGDGGNDSITVYSVELGTGDIDGGVGVDTCRILTSYSPITTVVQNC